jgi:hypothetical protein
MSELIARRGHGAMFPFAAESPVVGLWPGFSGGAFAPAVSRNAKGRFSGGATTPACDSDRVTWTTASG